MKAIHQCVGISSLLAVGVLSSAALAQPVDSANKFSWGENIGWMNWGDAGTPAGASAVVLSSGFLSGYIWCENVGWVSVGDGTPVSGTSYANVNGTDFGVNVNTSTGELTGFAWGENVGWINFSGGALATPANPARVDFGASRLRGYAWGENIGWINLDHPVHYVGFVVGPCNADYNMDGSADNSDVIDLANDIAAGTQSYPPNSPDFNNDGGADNADILDLANVVAGGACP